MTEQNITPDHNPDRHSPDYEFRPFPGTTPPAPKKKRWFTKPVFILPVAAFVLGSGLGAMNKPEPVTVTQEVPGPERIVEKEKRVEVPVTPTECITALDLAGSAIGTLAQVGTLAGEGIMAAYTRNGPELESITGKVKALNQKITDDTPAIGAASDACRASAK